MDLYGCESSSGASPKAMALRLLTAVALYNDYNWDSENDEKTSLPVDPLPASFLRLWLTRKASSLPFEFFSWKATSVFFNNSLWDRCNCVQCHLVTFWCKTPSRPLRLNWPKLIFEYLNSNFSILKTLSNCEGVKELLFRQYLSYLPSH